MSSISEQRSRRLASVDASADSATITVPAAAAAKPDIAKADDSDGDGAAKEVDARRAAMQVVKEARRAAEVTKEEAATECVD